MLGHVGPMACSGTEPSEGCLLSGPLLRELPEPQASGSWALPFQSCKIIAINAACLLEALKAQRRGLRCGGFRARSGLFGGGLGGCGVGFLPWEGAVRLTLGQW